jgi:hypothetical protein
MAERINAMLLLHVYIKNNSDNSKNIFKKCRRFMTKVGIQTLLQFSAFHMP